MIKLNDEVKFTILKGRNLIYYYENDIRERKQYLHVVREFRKTVVKLYQRLEDNRGEKSLFKDIMNLIDPKIKPTECGETIMKLKEIYNNYGIKLL